MFPIEFTKTKILIECIVNCPTFFHTLPTMFIDVFSICETNLNAE